MSFRSKLLSLVSTSSLRKHQLSYKFTGLQRFLLTSSILGQTYRGARIKQKGSIGSMIKTLWAVYDIASSIALFYFFSLEADESTTRLAAPYAQKILLKVVMMMSLTSGAFQYILAKFILFKNGPQLMKTITSLPKMFIQSDIKIATRLIIVLILSIVVTTFVNSLSHYGYQLITDTIQVYQSKRVIFIYNIIVNFTYYATNLSLSCLMTYSAWFISNIFASLTLDVNKYDLDIKFIRRVILDVQEKVNSLNHLLSPLMLFTMLCNSIVIISSCCVIVKADEISPLTISCGWWALLSSGQIIICCLASETLVHAFDRLCKRIEWRFASRDMISESEYQEFGLILSLKDHLVFSASHLFHLRASTILSIASFIITYAVILVQTDGSGSSDGRVIVRSKGITG